MLEQKQSIVFLLMAPILPEVLLQFRLRLLLFPQTPLKSDNLLTKKQSVIIGSLWGLSATDPLNKLTLNCCNNPVQISYFFFKLLKWVQLCLLLKALFQKSIDIVQQWTVVGSPGPKLEFSLLDQNFLFVKMKLHFEAQLTLYLCPFPFVLP